MHAYEVISLLEGTSSKTGKEVIVLQAYEAGCFEFFLGAQLAYSKFVTFGVGEQHIPYFKDITRDASARALLWIDFKCVADMLRSRTVTGGDATTAITVAAEHCTEELWDGWYRRVLVKDFKAGLTEGTINKVLKALVKAGDTNAEQFMVEVFTCQLAQPREKFEKKMVGNKLIDLKLDGARVLAVCDKDTNTVTLCSRNGLVKTNFPEIERLILDKLMPNLTRSVVLDGEMVSRDYKSLMQQFNRRTNVNTTGIKFAVFDFIWLDDFRAGKSAVIQSERDKAVGWACRTIGDDRLYHIKKTLINLDTPEGMAELEEFNAKATAAGFEGTMVKDPNAPYVTKRSAAWIKIKPMVTVDVQIVDCELGEQDGKYKDCLGRIHCAGLDEESGKFIQVSPGAGTHGSMTDPDRITLWERHLKGELKGLTIEVIGHEITQDKDGNYSVRHPRMVCFRPDKDGTAEYDKSIALIESKMDITL